MIHDMTTARARGVDRTRSEIVAAVAAMIADQHPASVTVPAVADRARVSVRTVYRHFPTKADLLDATSRRYLDHVGAEAAPRSSSELERHLGPLWQIFAADVDAVRAEHATAVGRDLRVRRLESARPGVVEAIEREAPGLPDAEREQLVDLVIGLTSSSMFLELADRIGRDATQAADLALWAVRALIAVARAEGIRTPAITDVASEEER